MESLEPDAGRQHRFYVCDVRSRAQVEQHLADHGAVFQHGDHAFGGCGGLRCAGVDRGPQVCQRQGALMRAVPDMDFVPRFQQALCHAVAHEPNTQHSDFHCFSLR